MIKKQTLRETTIEMLKKRPANVKIRDIQAATGVGWSTIYDLASDSNPTPMPAVDTIQAIYDYLSDTPLTY